VWNTRVAQHCRFCFHKLAAVYADRIFSNARYTVLVARNWNDKALWLTALCAVLYLDDVFCNARLRIVVEVLAV
jgi:hypothetical protein